MKLSDFCNWQYLLPLAIVASGAVAGVLFSMTIGLVLAASGLASAAFIQTLVRMNAQMDEVPREPERVRVRF